MPVDTSAFERQRRALTDDYAAKRASNTFGRFVSQQGFQRNQGTNQRNFQRGYGGMAGGWGRRGMTGGKVQSGFWRKALDDYVGDYTRNQGYAQQDYDTQVNQFNNTDAQLDASYQRSLADIEAEKAQLIANTALNIQALKTSF